MTINDLRIEYRTLRVGFCVRNGNIEDVVNAAKINTLLWGGIYNPIIPVGASDNLDHQLVKLFQVDILIPITETPEIKTFIEKYKWARFPISYHTNSIFREDVYNRDKKVVSVLDVSQVLRILWDKDFKFLKGNYSNCVFPKWLAKDKDKDILTLIFGQYPNENLSINYPEKYKKILRAKEVKIETGKSILAKLSSTVSPLTLTEYEVKSYGGRRIKSGVYVGKRDNFVDLINFWNIRASGSYITFLPESNTKRFIPFVRSHISSIVKSSDFEKKPVVHFWFQQEDLEKYKKIENVIKPLQTKKCTFVMSSASNHSWNGLNIVPSYNFLGGATTIASINAHYGKPKISFQLPDKPILKEQDKTFRHQYFVVSVRPSVGVEFPEYTTTLPVLPDLNEWYAREMVSDPFSLRVVKSHFRKTISIITESDTDTIQLNPINKFEVIKKVLERAGITAKKSGAGLIAERLIALMGGITGSAHIFKITGVRNFIEDTNPLYQKTKYEIIEKIRDNDSFKNFENDCFKGGKLLTPNDVFDEFIERKIIQAGLEVCCPKCEIKTWVNLKNVDEYYNCEYCHEKSNFIKVVKPIEIKVGHESCFKKCEIGENGSIEEKKVDDKIKIIDGTRWHYRLSGLLGNQDNQQGAIPVILTLLHLANKLSSGRSESLFSTALDLEFIDNEKEAKAETDLLVLDMAENMIKDDVEVLIGECKTGQTISKLQINKLIKIKNLIEKSGIKCHIVFVKIKNGFSESEINQFKIMYKSGNKPLLFTSNELERFWNVYENFKNKKSNFKLPFEHPLTFEELAENAAYVYNLR